MRIPILAFAMLILWTGQASATPAKATVRSSQGRSANGQFSFFADHKKKTVEIFTRAQGQDKAGPPLWSFDYDVQHDEFLLSDDGETVVILWWPRKNAANANDIAARFRNRHKGEFKTHKLNTLCDDFSNVGKLGFFTFADGAW